jgi:hypothetical protein
MTCAQIAIMPRNSASEASVAASSTTARTMFFHSTNWEQAMNIVHVMFPSQAGVVGQFEMRPTVVNARDGNWAVLLLLTLFAVVGTTSVSTAEKYWWLGPLLAGVAACLVIWFNWGQHRVRMLRIRRPFDAFLTIAPEAQGSECHELHVPPNADVFLQLRLHPRFPYKQLEFVFGFEGAKDSRPRALKVVNTFIKKGKRREQSPDDNESHYIDLNDNYHIRETAERTKPNCHAQGFLVRTKDPGRYPIRLEIITDCGESFPKRELFLIVEDRQSSVVHEAKPLTHS